MYRKIRYFFDDSIRYIDIEFDIIIVPDRSKYELRRHYFTHRIVSVWNSLPDSVLSVVPVSAESVNSFKSRLDKFWSMHEFVYDYRASPLAAGSV